MPAGRARLELTGAIERDAPGGPAIAGAALIVRDGRRLMLHPALQRLLPHRHETQEGQRHDRGGDREHGREGTRGIDRADRAAPLPAERQAEGQGDGAEDRDAERAAERAQEGEHAGRNTEMRTLHGILHGDRRDREGHAGPHSGSGRKHLDRRQRGGSGNRRQDGEGRRPQWREPTTAMRL